MRMMLRSRLPWTRALSGQLKSLHGKCKGRPQTIHLRSRVHDPEPCKAIITREVQKEADYFTHCESPPVSEVLS